MLNLSLPILDRLQDCWDPITEDQLDRLRSEIGASLPQQYVSFLKQFNGGYWAHEVWVQVDREASQHNVAHVATNFGVIPNKRFSTDDILDVCEQYNDAVPRDCVPIMQTLAGLICLSIHETEVGRVYYSDLGRYQDGEEFMLPIANSFAEFLLLLNPEDEKEFFRETLPVFQACERGDKHMVREYLDDAGKVDIRNEAGHTLAVCAARTRWPKILAMLLDAGADPSAHDSDGRCPLHHAVAGASLDGTKLLLAAGADARYRDSEGRNLAQIAHDGFHYRLQYFLEPLVS
ncbi:MAG: hypothetical protein DWQ37_22040 [Planctomycetota bacterium]|nr:MAG: hypothetical protein DWQ37_22040 [Planctomycetota bacterium]